MKIILLSSSRKAEEEPELVTKMFELGLESFHLRKARYSTKKLEEYINKIPAHFHNRIIIHSHHKLAAKYDLGGIHLTRIHLKRKYSTWLRLKWLSWKKPNLLKTLSYRKLASLYEEEAKWSYVFLSPIYDSLSGKYQSGYNEYSLKVAIKKTPHKVVARGGISLENIKKSNDIGFYGVALYSSIWRKENPIEAFINTIKYCQENGITME